MCLLSNSQNLQIPFYYVLFIQGSMFRDPPNAHGIKVLELIGRNDDNNLWYINYWFSNW